MLNFIRNLGPSELIVIGLILVLFFGAKKMSGLGKTAGETTREIKKASKELKSTITEIKSGGGESKEV